MLAYQHVLTQRIAGTDWSIGSFGHRQNHWTNYELHEKGTV